MIAHACTSLAEVRERIDELDVHIVRLLAQRFEYARQAATFKASAAEVPAPARAQEVIGKVRGLAMENGAPPEGVEAVYRALIGAMIAVELNLHKRP
jgi:isochorismate pyruvate lyase